MKMLGKRVIQLCLHSILILHRNSLITSKSKKRDFEISFFLRGECLLSLNIYLVFMNKVIGKRIPQLYYLKMKIFCEPCFIDIKVAMATL